MTEDERSVLAGHTEDPLEHGSGLGLWIVYWAAKASDGTVTHETSADGGTAITMRFQTAGG